MEMELKPEFIFVQKRVEIHAVFASYTFFLHILTTSHMFIHKAS